MQDTITVKAHVAATAYRSRPRGVRVDVVGVSRHAGDRQILHDVSFAVAPGALVALVGGSGAGKTTLVETMAGLFPPSEGTVLHDGSRAGSDGIASGIGYVPQDDIIHRELPLRRTLRYAAGLRLPAGTSAAAAERIVDETLRELDLADRSDVRVAALSGGQRKRASIAVELLTRPRLFFLDEPTSGLDPSTSAEVLGVLRRLTSRGVTVVLTTHSPADIDACDEVVFLAREGHLAFAGTPTEARAYFKVVDLSHVYRRLAEEASPMAWAERFAAQRRPEHMPGRPRRRAPERRGVGALRQWALLTRRSAAVMASNRLTLAVLIGSPGLVIAMMAMLFRPGGFEQHGPASLGPVQTVFWISFAGFFFGLTYGLLQVVGEMAVLRRERLAGLSVAAYVLSKFTVLAPVLTAVVAVLLGVLRALDRLPSLGWQTYTSLLFTLVIESLAALALGLLTSAAVADAAQATLALPMLCFPQVLFGGAIVPVVDMALPGRVVSVGMANRWAFESLGRSLHLEALTTQLPSVTAYRNAFGGPAASGWAVLAGSALVLTLSAMWVLHRRCLPGRSSRHRY